VLIFKLLLVVPLVFFTACSSVLKPPGTAGEADKPATAVTEVKKPLAGDTPYQTASFEPEVMFMLMTAEIAGQRGQYAIALEGYLEAAKRVKDHRIAERAAAIALYLKDQEKTDKAVRLWLQKEPNSLPARKIATMSALIASNQDAAVRYLDELLSLDAAGFEKTVLELAAVLQKEGKNGVLYDAFDALSKLHARNANVYLVKSLLAVQLGNLEQAMEDVQKALAVQPDWDRALALRAQLTAQSGEIQKAIADLEVAIAKNPKATKLQKLLAQVLIKNNDYKKARQVYRQLVRADPQDIESQVAEGLVALQLEEYDDAEEIFEVLLELPKWENQARFYLAKLEERRGNVSEAVSWYEKITDEAMALDAGLAAALLLAKDHQYPAAHARLDALVGRYPDQKLKVLVARAELFNQQKEHQKAFGLLSDALVLHPDDKNLLYTRALIADRLGKLDVLEADLHKILQQDPDNAEALNALGYTLTAKTTRYAEAEKYLHRALRIAPNEAAILDSYGWLQFKLGRYERALEYLQRAYAKQPVGEIAAHLAAVLWAMGRQEEAARIVEEALKNEPEDEHLLEFKRRVMK